MIPKIIHLCWLSGDPYPPEIQRCLDSWKEHLPDYEVWLWDTKRFDINSTLWTKQAFEKKKYAFVADYIRLYALYNYGGIYLDSDVLVYKSFDELLSLPYFIGHDQIGGFEAAVIGAEKGCEWIMDIMEWYQPQPFVIDEDGGRYNTLPLPCRFHHILVEKNYRFYLLHEIKDFKEQERVLYVFDGDFFNSRDSVEVRQTKKSFCAHNYVGAWRKKKKSIKRFLPKYVLKVVYFCGQRIWARNKYKWFQIPFEIE